MALLILASSFVVLVFTVYRLGKSDGNYTFDQNTYHLPSVHQLAAKWPAIDIVRDPKAAMAPGYHYFLATWAKIFALTDDGLKAVNLLVSFSLLLILAATLLRWRWTALAASALVMPLLCSSYFIKSACWLVTDNAALACSTAALSTVLSTRRLGNRTGRWVASGLFATMAVGVRQTSIWLVGPMSVYAGWSNGWLGRADENQPPVRISDLAWKMTSVGAPIALLAFFYVSWGGLTPPQWRDKTMSFSLLPLVLMVGFYGAFGLFYLPLLPARCLVAALQNRWCYVAGATVGVLALLPKSNYDPVAGRWGGPIWSVIQKLPAPSSHSPVVVVLGVVGVYVIFCLGHQFAAEKRPGEALALVAALLSAGTVQCFNQLVFQRYFEPSALVLVILSFGLIDRELGVKARSLAGVWLLAFLQLALTLLSLAI